MGLFLRQQSSQCLPDDHGLLRLRWPALYSTADLHKELDARAMVLSFSIAYCEPG